MKFSGKCNETGSWRGAFGFFYALAIHVDPRTMKKQHILKANSIIFLSRFWPACLAIILMEGFCFSFCHPTNTITYKSPPKIKASFCSQTCLSWTCPTLSCFCRIIFFIVKISHAEASCSFFCSRAVYVTMEINLRLWLCKTWNLFLARSIAPRSARKLASYKLLPLSV